MFCKRCGMETNNPSNICNRCIDKEIQLKHNNFEDKGGFKYAFLGFLFPLAGIILYYMLRQKEPNLSKSFRNGTIFGCALFILLIMFTIISNTLGSMMLIL